MQTLAHPLAPPPFTPQHAVRAVYPHRPINGSLSRPLPSTSTGTTSNNNVLPLPLPLPTPPVARKRKRPSVVHVNFSEVQELDADGRMRQVIVIDDTPPPPATISPAVSSSTTTAGYSMSMQPPIFGQPVRTRARAAAEAQIYSSSTNPSASVSALPGPAPKRRRRDPQFSTVVAPKKPVPASKYALAPAGKAAWQNASTTSVTDDVCGPHFPN